MDNRTQLKVSVAENVTLTHDHINHLCSLIQKYEQAGQLNLNDVDLMALCNDLNIDFKPTQNKISIKGYNPKFLVDYCTDKSKFKTISQALESMGISRMLYSLIKRGESALNDKLCDGNDILPWD